MAAIGTVEPVWAALHPLLPMSGELIAFDESRRSTRPSPPSVEPYAHPVRLRPVRTRTTSGLLICTFFVAATTACSGVESKEPERASPAASVPTGTSRPVETPVTVSLSHCDFAPLQHDGQTWEVSHPPPFDGTTAPDAWKGTGTVILLTADLLRYRDSSGIEVDFVPDDGKAPSPCA